MTALGQNFTSRAWGFCLGAMCVSGSSCSSCLLAFLLCEEHRHSGEALKEGLGMSWSSIGPGGIKLRRTWPAGTFGFPASPYHWVAAWQELWVDVLWGLGTAVSLYATGQDRALRQTPSVCTGNCAFTHTLIPAQMSLVENSAAQPRMTRGDLLR